MLGNIRFIGELFKLCMLTESIMHNCIMSLFKARDEDSLECLCRLLTTIGQGLDHEKGKVTNIIFLLASDFLLQIPHLIQFRQLSLWLSCFLKLFFAYHKRNVLRPCFTVESVPTSVLFK